MSAPNLTGNRCQCTACGEYFNGVQPFDKHRIGVYGVNRRCLSVAGMTARGWSSNIAGFWRERVKQPHARPRAPVFPARRAPRPRATPHPVARAPDAQRAGAP